MAGFSDGAMAILSSAFPSITRHNALSKISQYAISAFTEATMNSRVNVIDIADYEARNLPLGWEETESKTKPGEIRYLNKVTHTRVMRKPTQPAPGFPTKKFEMASKVSADEITAHEAYVQFCDDALQRPQSDRSLTLSLIRNMLYSLMTALM